MLVDKRSPRLVATTCPGPVQIGQWLVSVVIDKLADPFVLKISLAFRESDVLESWTSRETGVHRSMLVCPTAPGGPTNSRNSKVSRDWLRGGGVLIELLSTPAVLAP